MTHNELPLFYVFHFYFFGLISIISAIAFVTRKSPVSAAMWLVCTMFCLAAMYVMLDAQFIGTMQVLVYAGAIMVVFLFVIMLLNLGHPSELADARGLWWKLLLPLALGYIVAVATTVVTLDALGFARGSVPFHTGLILLNLAAVVILFNIVDRGRIISPAYSRLNRRDLDKLRAISAPHRAPLVPESGD